ncbi:MAG: arsenate reductase (glutaredoxin) [Gammaproteobacteria bacterium]
MSRYTIYHNPKCSKSREALKILQRHQIQPIIVEYLKNPQTLEQIKSLRTHFDLKDFVRTNEPIFKELKLSFDNEDALLLAMSKEPILMQRPIVTHEEKAVIARPPEKVLELINHA